MSAFDPCHRTAHFHAAINALDFDEIGRCLADDAVYRSGKIGRLAGRVDIVTAFRRYFDCYPDQVAKDLVIEALSPVTCRSVWELTATSAVDGSVLRRCGEETITFDAAGRIIDVAVTDYGQTDEG